MSEEEATALDLAGRRLASDKTWWGDAEEPEDRSVNRCLPRGNGEWSVRIYDAVGLISVGDLQIEVRPKIPVPHLLYLFGESGRFPRLGDRLAQAMSAASLWELVAMWFLAEMEVLFRKDLLRDY